MLVLMNDTKEKMNQHALQTYPEECCGILLGHSIKGTRFAGYAVPVKNHESVHSSSCFRMDPLTVAEIEEQADAQGLRIVGFYHSHPDCEAVLSEEDRRYMIPECSYPVIAVTKGRCQRLQSYVKSEAQQEKIVIENIREVSYYTKTDGYEKKRSGK